jgi:ketopantoate hydroxymethyltransferase
MGLIPKFLKKYLDINLLIKEAVNDYCMEVDGKIFLKPEHSYMG